MLRFIVRRGAQTIVTMFFISVVTFAIFFLTPGSDPARRLAGRYPNPSTISAIRRQFDLNRPWPYQYLHMMKDLFITRDLPSYANQGVNVVSEVLAAAPVTLSLVLGATVLWLIFGVLTGVIAARWKGTVLDPALMVLALVGISMPVVWIGQMLLYVTQDRWHDLSIFHWIPAAGYIPLTQNPIEWAEHLVVPWIVLSIAFIGLYGRVLRGDILEVENEEYVRTARAKGLSEGRVFSRHVLRMALTSFISLFGLDFGALIGGGAILTEVVFGLPGVGYLTYNAISNLDLPLIMVTVLYGAFFIVLASAVVDIAYAWLDPRVREVGAG